MIPCRSNTERRDTEAGHFYIKGYAEVPGITTVLDIIHKPQVVEWMIRQERESIIAAAGRLVDQGKISPISFRLALQQGVPTAGANKKERQKAAELGSAVHQAIENFMRSKLGRPTAHIFLTAEAQERYGRFIQWTEQVDFEPLACELPLVHGTYDYGGTLDFAAKIDGKLHLVEVKTSQQVWLPFHLQLHALKSLWESAGYGEVDQMSILHLPAKDYEEPFDFIKVKYSETTMAVFLAALTLWEFMHGHIKEAGHGLHQSPGVVRSEGIQSAGLEPEKPAEVWQTLPLSDEE